MKGSPWTSDDIALLKQLVSERRAAKHIAEALQRTIAAVYTKSNELNIRRPQSIRPSDVNNLRDRWKHLLPTLKAQLHADLTR